MNKAMLKTTNAAMNLRRDAFYLACGGEMIAVLKSMVTSLERGRAAAAAGKSVELFSNRLRAALLRAKIVIRQSP
jgi:hypothetical protein